MPQTQRFSHRTCRCSPETKQNLCIVIAFEISYKYHFNTFLDKNQEAIQIKYANIEFKINISLQPFRKQTRKPIREDRLF